MKKENKFLKLIGKVFIVLLIVAAIVFCALVVVEKILEGMWH